MTKQNDTKAQNYVNRKVVQHSIYSACLFSSIPALTGAVTANAFVQAGLPIGDAITKALKSSMNLEKNKIGLIRGTRLGVQGMISRACNPRSEIKEKDLKQISAGIVGAAVLDTGSSIIPELTEVKRALNMRANLSSIIGASRGTIVIPNILRNLFLHTSFLVPTIANTSTSQEVGISACNAFVATNFENYFLNLMRQVESKGSVCHREALEGVLKTARDPRRMFSTFVSRFIVNNLQMQSLKLSEKLSNTLEEEGVLEAFMKDKASDSVEKGGFVGFKHMSFAADEVGTHLSDVNSDIKEDKVQTR